MSFADLHLHLLPGVDDGPGDEDAALRHARHMAADGVHEATVTPHVGHPGFAVDLASIPARTARLQASLDAEAIDLRLHPGGEIHASAASRLRSAELETVAHGPAGARWVLLEVPLAGIDEAFLHGCARIRDRGFGLLLAHPERAPGLMTGGLRLLRPELARGALLQVNACSLMGRHGEEARKAGERLVRSGLAWVVASDGHPPHRAHTLRSGFDLARRAGASATQAWRLTEANPRFLLRHGVPNIGAAVAAAAWQPASRTRVDAARRAAARVGG
jgi:protein-tyrosine phosphatase